MTRRTVVLVSILAFGVVLAPVSQAARTPPGGAIAPPPQGLPQGLYSSIITLDHPDPQANSQFGFGLDGAGDVNGDGVPDLLIAAAFQDIGGFANQGRAYVFSGADGTLLYRLDDPIAQSWAAFGERLAGVGDVNGDGASDLLVGAEGQHVAGNSWQGQAFLFSGADGTLIRILDNPAPQPSSFFGWPVARAADFSADGVADLLVGAPGQDVGGFNMQGQAFVFDAVTGAVLLTLDAPYSNPVGRNGPFFGESVVQAGDVNGDAVPDLLAGARDMDVGGVLRQGQAYVLSGADGSLLRTLDSPNPEFVGAFGFPVGAAGDLNSDGVADLLVGAYNQGVAGQAFAFSGADGSPLLTLDNPSGQPYTFFSFYQLVDVGDVSGDGVPDILIGAEGVTVGGNAYQGQAYLFSGADGSLLHTFDHPSPQASGAFGVTAASVGDVDGDGLSDLLIAASCQTVGGNVCQGQAYLYLSGATPEDLLTSLVDSVIDMNVEQNISSSLDAKVDAALTAVQDVNENNDVAAIRSLQAFINSVEAQRGGKLTDEQADQLIAAAQQIIDLIGG